MALLLLELRARRRRAPAAAAEWKGKWPPARVAHGIGIHRPNAAEIGGESSGDIASACAPLLENVMVPRSVALILVFFAALPAVEFGSIVHCRPVLYSKARCAETE